MPPGVKICGLTRIADVEWAVACGADAVGVVLAPSSRQVDRSSVRELLRAPEDVASLHRQVFEL